MFALTCPRCYTPILVSPVPPPVEPSAAVATVPDQRPRRTDRLDGPPVHLHQHRGGGFGSGLGQGMGIGVGLVAAVIGLLALATVGVFITCCGGMNLFLSGNSSSSTPPVPMETRPTAVSTVPPPQLPPQPPPEPARVTFGQAHIVDGLQISIVEAYSGPIVVTEKFTGEQQVTDQHAMLLRVRLANAHSSRIFHYRTWGERRLFDGGMGRVIDSHGNNYTKITRSFGKTVLGEIDQADIHPRESVHDVLLFDKALQTATYFDVDLPLENVGLDGAARFRIPAASVTRRR